MRWKNQLLNTQFLFILLLVLLLVTLKIYEEEEEAVNTSVFERIQKFKELTHQRKIVEKCGRFPKPENLYTISTHWHVMRSSNTTFLIYNAYLDDRLGMKDVRIILYASDYKIKENFYCQFWNGNHSTSVRVDEFRVLWFKYWIKSNLYTPMMVTCKIPSNFEATHVSLVKSPCDEANNLKEIISHEQSDKREFLVCVKDLEFDEDKSSMLIEWIEIMRILRVDKISFYVVEIHANMMKVLEFYESIGFVEIVNFTQPEMLPLKRQNSIQSLMRPIISYNDCLYRHLNLFNFIILLDIDEIIVPFDRTLNDLISQRYSSDLSAAFSFPIYDFILEDSSNFDFLKTTKRAENYTKFHSSLMRLDRVLTIHKQLPLSCVMDEKCSITNIDKSHGQLSHYRLNCKLEKDKQMCKKIGDKTVEDYSLWKYKDELTIKIEESLKNIFGK